jgi:hypothetical protein
MSFSGNLAALRARKAAKLTTDWKGEDGLDEAWIGDYR